MYYKNSWESQQTGSLNISQLILCLQQTISSNQLTFQSITKILKFRINLHFLELNSSFSLICQAFYQVKKNHKSNNFELYVQAVEIIQTKNVKYAGCKSARNPASVTIPLFLNLEFSRSVCISII